VESDGLSSRSCGRRRCCASTTAEGWPRCALGMGIGHWHPARASGIRPVAFSGRSVITAGNVGRGRRTARPRGMTLGFEGNPTRCEREAWPRCGGMAGRWGRRPSPRCTSTVRPRARRSSRSARLPASAGNATNDQPPRRPAPARGQPSDRNGRSAVVARPTIGGLGGWGRPVVEVSDSAQRLPDGHTLIATTAGTVGSRSTQATVVWQYDLANRTGGRSRRWRQAAAAQRQPLILRQQPEDTVLEVSPAKEACGANRCRFPYLANTARQRQHA